MKTKNIDRLILAGVLLFIVFPVIFTITYLSIDAHKANQKWKETNQQVYTAAWYQCRTKQYPSWKYLGSRCFRWEKEYTVCKCSFSTEERNLIEEEIVIYKDENGVWK